MKLRTGFVSNSSSSSFVLIGIRCKITTEILKKMVEFKNVSPNPTFDHDELLNLCWTTTLGLSEYFRITDDDKDLLGRVFIGDDEYGGSNEFNLEKILTTVREMFEFLGIDEEIKIITGSVMI